MSVVIKGIEPNSPAQRAGIQAGETLVSLNGHDIIDILDYRFYETNAQLEIKLSDVTGQTRIVSMKKGQYQSIGLEFETYLMDKQHSCRCKCVFCFIDQMPKGMRESLYFKDDDSRLSFLFGNYVTLTNLKEKDVQRIIDMKISPINVSVHTTNPELRVKMMGNRFAGQVLEILPRLANAGIQLNCQLVLCPGINDGAELERSLTDLGKLAPALQSIALVPVGVTKYRDGLFPLRPYTKEEAGQTIDIIDRFGERFEQEFGSCIAYASDEFYLTAERQIPPPEFYGDFSQIESGVGAMACLKDEFLYALEERLDGQETLEIPKRHITLATGVAAYPFLNELLDEVRIKCNNLTCNVVPIINHFFGETITVAGLMTGTDILSQLKEKTLGDELLLPEVILRHNTNILLDDITLDDISNQLQIPIKTVMNDGQHLLNAVLGE